MIKVVFFDIGSVILRKVSPDPWEVAAGLFGTDRDTWWKATGHVLRADSSLIAPPYTSTLQEEREMGERLMRAGLRHLKLSASDEKIQSAVQALIYRTYVMSPGAIEVLEYLKPRYRLGLITNAAPSRRLDLQNHDLEKWFDPLIISAEVGMKKPDTEIYLHALDMAKVTGDEAVFVDDLPKFLDGAKEAGIGLTILYDPDGKFDGSKHKTIKHFEELKEML